jgi:hypothetical protein
MDLGDTALIERECLAYGLTTEQIAYVLATAYWETGRTMKPVREAFGKSQADTIARLDRAWNKGQLTWVSAPYWRADADGKAWFGRGYVQLTWKANYEKAGRKLGVDLVGDPSLAMKPEVAAQILVQGMMEGWFTGKALPDYVGKGKKDYLGARRVVNGTDKAKAIAELAREYEAELNAKPLPKPRSSPAKSTTLQATAGTAVAGATGAATAISQLDGTAQLVVIGAAVLAGLLLIWIARERLRKWAEGDR